MWTLYNVSIAPTAGRENHFLADRLHFNAHGYKLLAERIRPYLMDDTLIPS